jgi:hypothetical protein
MTTPANTSRSPKWLENYEAIGQLLRQLEGSLNEYKDDERCVVIVMIKFLHRLNVYDRDLEIIIDSVRSLTSKRRLRAVIW